RLNPRVHDLLVDGRFLQNLAQHYGRSGVVQRLPAGQVGESSSERVGESDQQILAWVGEPEVQRVGEQPPVKRLRAFSGLQVPQVTRKGADPHYKFVTLLCTVFVMKMVQPAVAHRVSDDRVARLLERGG